MSSASPARASVLRRIAVDRVCPSPEAISEAAAVLRAGGVVAYPAEHFYALACDPWNADAVASLFAVKGRDEGKPILLAVCDDAGLNRVADAVPEAARPLTAAWPAGLTLVVPAVPTLPEALTAGFGTVGVRRIAAGSAPVAAALIGPGGALPATSANRSGDGATGDPETVAALDGVDLLLDAGKLPEGKLSTLVDITRIPWRLLREGACPADTVGKWGKLEGEG